MRGNKKRKADRVYDDKEGEANLPVRKTAEIASTHAKGINGQEPEIIREVGISEKGKEDFDFLLKQMSSPDSQ